jgi:peptide/nickel transport system permease protein
MIVRLLKQPQFLIGFLFIASLILLSFIYPSLMDVQKESKFLYDENEVIVGVAPFSPKDMPPFGTDMNGKHLLYLVLEGAKYTILITLVIAFLRIFFALFFSLFHRKSKSTFFDDIVQATLYIPTAILAYMFMVPLFVKDATEPMGMMTLIVVQCLILVGIGVPPLVSTFSEEIRSILAKDYIVSTFSLGSKKPYVYYKHVLPELSSKLLLLFAQQAIQTLILLAHLGVLAVFIGGSQTVMMGDIFNLTPATISLSGEWAGIIGQSYQKLLTAPWIILVPLSFFAFTIFSINLMIQGIQNSLESNKS